MGSLKVHRAADFVFPNTTQWHVLSFDALNAGESLGGLAFTGPAQDEIVCSLEGLWMVGGCLRAVYTAGGNPTVTVASRIVTSTDGGATWTEKRCLQAVHGRSRQQDVFSTQPYAGTAYMVVGELLRLESRTSDTGMILQGWPGFDLPQAVSFWGTYEGVP